MPGRRRSGRRAAVQPDDRDPLALVEATAARPADVGQRRRAVVVDEVVLEDDPAEAGRPERALDRAEGRVSLVEARRLRQAHERDVEAGHSAERRQVVARDARRILAAVHQALTESTSSASRFATAANWSGASEGVATTACTCAPVTVSGRSAAASPEPHHPDASAPGASQSAAATATTNSALRIRRPPPAGTGARSRRADGAGFPGAGRGSPRQRRPRRGSPKSGSHRPRRRRAARSRRRPTPRTRSGSPRRPPARRGRR